jgi:hypothetical protein
VASADEKTLFVGIARRSAVASYLSGVDFDEVTRIGQPELDYRRHPGGSAATPPGEQGFWAESAVGVGTQTITWRPNEGTWVLVVMNADGSPGVDVEADIAAELPVLPELAVGLLVAGAAVMAGAAVAIYLAASRDRGPDWPESRKEAHRHDRGATIRGLDMHGGLRAGRRTSGDQDLADAGGGCASQRPGGPPRCACAATGMERGAGRTLRARRRRP